MFKLPNLGLILTVFKAGVVVGVFVGAAAGALAGAAGGLLTAPMSGKKLRNRIKQDAEKGVQAISESSEILKEQGLNLMGKLGSPPEVETEEPLQVQEDQVSSRRNGSKSSSKRSLSA